MLRVITVLVCCYITALASASQEVIQQATQFIAEFELYERCAYEDIDGYAVGYGTRIIQGKEVTENTCITEKRARVLLVKRITKDLNTLLSYNVVLTTNQQVALLSFMYNLGSGILRKSKILESQNVCKTLLRYTRAGGKILKGLKTRRQQECRLYEIS